MLHKSNIPVMQNITDQWHKEDTGRHNNVIYNVALPRRNINAISLPTEKSTETYITRFRCFWLCLNTQMQLKEINSLLNIFAS